MLQSRIAIIVALACYLGCTEPCVIPTESPPVTGVVQLKAGSLITYESTITDSNIKIFQRPPWVEKVLTFGATIGGRDSVTASESLEDRAMRFQDIDAHAFYFYMPLGTEHDIMKAGFWLKLPLTMDTIVAHVTDTSEWLHPIDVTYKSYWVHDGIDTIDGKAFPIKQIQTDYSWDDRDLNDVPAHEERRLLTNVIQGLGIFSEQTASDANGRPRSHTIVRKIEF